MTSRRKRIWPWLIGLVVALAAALLLVKKSGAGPLPLDAALIVPVKRGPFAVEVIDTGHIEAREKVELKSKVAGQVAEVRVEEGTHVEKGQVLLVLDPTDYQRDVARAAAEVEQAKSAIAFAKIESERKARGVEEHVIGRNELTAARHDLEAKTIALRIAQIALGAAQDRVRYTKIVSPIAGTVIQRGIQPGEVVTPGVQSTFDGKPLLTVADLAKLVVKVDLNQIDVARVRIGQEATVTLDALPGKTYKAVMTKIAPASLRRPGKDLEVFPVEAEIAAGDAALKPGMTADVRIRLEAKEQALSLPIEAIVKDAGKSFVNRVIEGADGKQTTEKIEVTLGARNDREVEVLSGLRDGERVLINPPSASDNETRM